MRGRALILAVAILTATVGEGAPKPTPKPKPPNAYERMLSREAADRAMYDICRKYQRKGEEAAEAAFVARTQRDVDSLLKGNPKSEPRQMSEPDEYRLIHGHDCDAGRSAWEADTLWLTTHKPPKGTKPYDPNHERAE